MLPVSRLALLLMRKHPQHQVLPLGGAAQRWLNPTTTRVLQLQPLLIRAAHDAPKHETHKVEHKGDHHAPNTHKKDDHHDPHHAGNAHHDAHHAGGDHHDDHGHGDGHHGYQYKDGYNDRGVEREPTPWEYIMFAEWGYPLGMILGLIAIYFAHQAIQYLPSYTQTEYQRVYPILRTNRKVLETVGYPLYVSPSLGGDSKIEAQRVTDLDGEKFLKIKAYVRGPKCGKEVYLIFRSSDSKLFQIRMEDQVIYDWRKDEATTATSPLDRLNKNIIQEQIDFDKDQTYLHKRSV